MHHMRLKRIVIAAFVLIVIIEGFAVFNNLGLIRSTVRLYVSNQSQLDDPVKIAVHVDGNEVFNRTCWLDDSHNWTKVILSLPLGVHTLRATEQGNDITQGASWLLPADKWIIVDYGYTGDQPHFSIHVHATKISFM